MTAGSGEAALDLLAIGRISVDLFAREANASFLDQQTFAKSIGGSPSNVAVAGARLGLRSALATGVGDDALGGYVLAKLASLGVDTRFVQVRPGGVTPIVLVALDNPAEPSIVFYREPQPPDTTVEQDAVDDATLAQCGVVWISASALAAGQTAGTARHWLERRGRQRHTVLDLDLRPSLWADPTDAVRAAEEAIARSTVVVGNRSECAMALGTAEPHEAADELLARGVSLAVVKMGAEGVLLATSDERIVVSPIPITVRCGSGAGDAFGGALTAGLVRGWSLRRIGRLANAAGALVTSRLTCADAMPTLAELEEFAGPDDSDPARPRTGPISPAGDTTCVEVTADEATPVDAAVGHAPEGETPNDEVPTDTTSSAVRAGNTTYDAVALADAVAGGVHG